jgi:two-component system chemotaxis sensor kinase CheA
MDELLGEFLTETAESLGEVDVELVNLEQNPNDHDLLASIFRIVHTIKGTCGFIGLARLETLAHAGENVLGKFRDRELEVTPEAITVVLASIDRIKMILAHIEETEAEPEGEDTDLIAQLNEIAEGRIPSGLTTAAGAPAAADEAHEEMSEAEMEMASAMEAEAEPEPEPEPAPEAGDDEIGARPGEVSLDELERIFQEADGPEGGSEAAIDEATADSAAPSVEAAPEPEPEPEAQLPAAPAKVPATTNKAPVPVEDEKRAKDSALSNQTIRVNVELLENLMTMVSELVLTRNQLLQLSRSEEIESERFTVPLQRLSQVTTELQEGVMKTRMQPIGNAWSKLPRIIRDLSIELGKKIELQMYGADTELDRQILELIKDPLTHMVRNSADHGLEMPDARRAAGKSETGHVVLNAYHEGGHIIVEISDDGAGIDPERIKAKAIQKGLTTEAEAAQMSDQQILQFIFKAGFSTAEQVTAVSGRGVGMDVVRTNIEKIGGTIDLKATVGKGSSFKIKIPLTLAIVSALIVETAGERYAIPQLSVLELVRTGEGSDHKIEEIQGTPVMRLRERLLPLISLRSHLDLEGGDMEEIESFVVVTQVGPYQFGILVDRVFDTEEIVVKPVAPILRELTVFSGNTILGDGAVIMILDPNGIAAETGEILVPQDKFKDEEALRLDTDDITSLLLFRSGAGGPKAVPLSLVARIEMIDLSKVETSEGRPLIQYRGELMPLVPCVGAKELEREGGRPALVFTEGRRSMGMVVDEILDIVEETINIGMEADAPGMMGSSIISGQATDVIDAGFYLTKAFGDWFRTQNLPAPGQNGKKSRKKLLLVDDSAFFRNLMAPVLSSAGYQVTAVDSAAAALELHDQGHDFDAIVTDIEMPNMDGFELARRITTNSRWKKTPIVALTSRTNASDIEKGHEVGFHDYIEKLDRDSLLERLPEMTS